jgi:hypothetical protein
MIEGRRALPGPGFYILPHPGAPLFALESKNNAQLIVKQLIDEVSTGNFPDTEAFIQMLRQLGFVSLWFFLKFILGSNGPYNELNDDLHREMCNFRQGTWCMAPGARAAVLLPRGFLKSTIMTHGADHWELTRNPDECIAIANKTATKAASFRSVIKTSTEKNYLYRACYPEVLPGRDAKRWNESEIVFGGRSRNYAEPSVYAIGVGAASEGLHFTLFNPDDLVGLDDLDVEHMGNLNMMSSLQWFKTNRRALLRSQKKSRIVFAMTRFSIDDPSNSIIEDAKLFLGYVCEEFEEKAGGTWTVYNRLGIEDGVEVNPEVLTAKDLADQMEDDYWGAMTQSMNRPAKTGMVEFSDFKVKPASLIWDDSGERWLIALSSEVNFGEDNDHPPRPLSSFDVVMGIDPASTDKDISAKTSRTAICIWAVDKEENCVLLWRRVGYYPPVVADEKGELIGGWFKYIFDGARKFRGAVRSAEIEAAAMQKVLAPILERESKLPSAFPLYFHPIPALGDKDARIRMKLQPLLARGKIYAVNGEELELKQEIKVFPQSKWRKDLLDATEKALSAARPPLSEEEYDSERRVNSSSFQEVNETTGY